MDLNKQLLADRLHADRRRRQHLQPGAEEAFREIALVLHAARRVKEAVLAHRGLPGGASRA